MVIVNVDFVVLRVKEFPRKSGSIGQELYVDSEHTYPARLDCVDKDILDLSVLKNGDKVTFKCQLYFKTLQLVSDSGKKYYNRVPLLKVVGIYNE